MRIFVKKRMRSHGMPMVFQIGSLASLATIIMYILTNYLMRDMMQVGQILQNVT